MSVRLTDSFKLSSTESYKSLSEGDTELKKEITFSLEDDETIDTADAFEDSPKPNLEMSKVGKSKESVAESKFKVN